MAQLLVGDETKPIGELWAVADEMQLTVSLMSAPAPKRATCPIPTVVDLAVERLQQRNTIKLS